MDPRKAQANTGAIVQQFISRHPESTKPSTAAPGAGTRKSLAVGKSSARGVSSVDIGQLNVTGINPWWRYEEGDIPGVGHWMVNAHWQNLIVQADDLDIPYRGIDLAFRRTYNSFSNHNFASDDGSTEPGQYGNGWTNTFDAHMSTNNCPSTGYSWAGYTGFSVYDVDGARYDYCFNAAGTLVPPAGMQGTSLVANPDGGSFYWTKKNKTQYTFFSPYYGGTSAAYSGRIYRISARNQSNYIQFTYAWATDASSAANLTNIYATTDSGTLQAVLTFDLFNGQRLLSQLTRPDHAVITYNYDGSGNLISVDKPAPDNSGVPVRQGYGGYHSFLWVNNPRWNRAYNTSTNTASDGGYVAFQQGGTANAQTIGVSWVAVMNGVPPDGTNTYLQPGVALGPIQYRYESVSAGSNYTSFTDTDGHQEVQYIDGWGHPTVRQQNAGSPYWLQTWQYWDTSGNRTATIDPRGYQTDYSYDTRGNTVAVAAPATVTAAGTFRPTQLYDYDANDNVVAHCDEKASHANGGRGDWTNAGPPTFGGPDSLCASNGSGAHDMFTYSPSSEPFGRLTNIRSPLGYNRAIGYDLTQQGGVDHGLPTSVRGDAIAQSDGLPNPTYSTRVPFETMTYDAVGNLICASRDGSDATTTSLLAYDSLNRVVSIGDPDDGSVTNGACSKTPGIPGSAIATRTTYFPDGRVATTQTPAEAAASVTTQFQYDLDGNTTSEVRNYTSTAGTTKKWYDGADRLVEVLSPTDPLDYYTFPWIMRYLYDLTGGGTVSVASSPQFRAYGNIYKTQELLPLGVPNPQWNEDGSGAGPSTGTGNPGWQDTAGTAFDPLDRALVSYRNTGSSLITTMHTYDGAGAAGLLSQQCNANSECKSFEYDPRSALVRATFNVQSSSAQTFGHDEVGRVVSAANGVGSFADVYDADGRKTLRTQTVGSQSASISYSFYGDGTRSSLGINTGTQNLPNALTYTYWPSGPLRSVAVAGISSFAFAYTGGRRLTSRSDNTGQPAYTSTYSSSASTPTSSGLVQSMTSPGFYETGITYSAAGSQLRGDVNGWTGAGFYGTAAIFNKYTSRNELSSGVLGNLFANGVAIPLGRSTSTIKSALYQFNAFQSRPLQSNAGNSCTQACIRNDVKWSYDYDATGRQINSNYNNDEAAISYTNSKMYDAEDHLVLQAMPDIASASKVTYRQSLGYQWGPLGHPLQIGSTSAVPAPGTTQQPTDFQYDSLIWDDEDLLFTINAAGQINDLKVGDFGDYVPGAAYPLTVWDRDVSGQIRGCHNGAGPASAQSAPKQNPMASCALSGSSFIYPKIGFQTTAVGRGGMLLVQKSDGFSDSANTFQGVRTYDPQAGVWTTPDAYHGDVHDPMSQKPYMWNRNNPYVYSDPRGYDPLRQEEGEASGLDRMVGARGYLARLAANARSVLKVPKNAPRISEDNASHMFENRKGHVPDTALNRALLQKTVSDPNNQIRAPKTLEQGGTLESYEMKLPSGATAWAEVRVTTGANGQVTREITNGGINAPK